MEGVEHALIGNPTEELPRGLYRPDSDPMSEVRGANPAAQRAADAAVAIEEQDVVAGLHDSHLAPRSADLNNSYVSKESLSHARCSSEEALACSSILRRAPTGRL